MLAESAMRDEVDRVAAAAGVAVVHVAHPPSRQAWTGARAVILDAAGAGSCWVPSLPRRAHVIMVSRGEPQAPDWQTAISVGAQHVMNLPADEADLVAALSAAAASGGDGDRGPDFRSDPEGVDLPRPLVSGRELNTIGVDPLSLTIPSRWTIPNWSL